MSLTFFADHCVPSSIIRALQEAGHNVLILKDRIPTDSPDQRVISQAQQLNAILLTLNGDFADIVTYPPASYKGIVSVQLHNHPETSPELMQRLLAYLAANNDMKHYLGKLLIVEPHRIRTRS